MLVQSQQVTDALRWPERSDGGAGDAGVRARAVIAGREVGVVEHVRVELDTLEAGQPAVLDHVHPRHVRSEHGATVLVFQPSPRDLAAMGVNPMRLLRGADVVEAAGTTVRLRLEARPELREQLAQR